MRIINNQTTLVLFTQYYRHLVYLYAQQKV